MQRFLDGHADRLVGVLTGFDRVLFRGTLRMISNLRGMNMFLSRNDEGDFIRPSWSLHRASDILPEELF